MNARIVHFSDWHGEAYPLPKADIYVCTGDMYPNTKACFWADKEPERRAQLAWARKNNLAHLLDPNATLILVRGNHDYADLAPLFAGYHSVYELKEPSIVNVGGIRFGGFRGVPTITGEWADEMGETELDYRCSQLEGAVDVLVTHGPAFGRLDDNYGSRAIRDWLKKYRPQWHLHGHIHETAGGLELEGVRTSNAACTVRTIEVSK